MKFKLFTWFNNLLCKFLPLQRFELTLIGALPRPDAPKWYIFLGIFYAFFNAAQSIAELMFPFYNTIGLQTTLDCLGPAIEKLRVAFKQLIIIWKRKEFYQVLKDLNIMYDSYQEKNQVEISRGLSKKSSILCVVLSVFAGFTGFFLAFSPIFKNIYRISQGESWEMTVPFLSKYPWDHQKSPAYGITYFVQVYCSFLMDIAIPGLDCLFTGICFHIAAEFQCIGIRLKNIATEVNRRTTDTGLLSTTNTDDVMKSIKRIIEEYCTCMDLKDMTVSLFQEMVMAHFLSSALFICVNAVNLTIAEPAQKPIYVAYICTLLTQAFLYCLSGELVLQSVRFIF